MSRRSIRFWAAAYFLTACVAATRPMRPLVPVMATAASAESTTPILSTFRAWSDGTNFSAVQIGGSKESKTSLFLSVAHAFRDRRRSVRVPQAMWLWSPRGGEPISARLVAWDESRDLSLIEGNGFIEGTAVAKIFSDFTDSFWHGPSRGEQIVLVGYPEGEGPYWAKSTCDGYRGRYMRLVDDPPWHGDSGGGVFIPASGELVAILQAYEEHGSKPVGFAQASKSIWVFLNSRTTTSVETDLLYLFDCQPGGT